MSKNKNKNKNKSKSNFTTANASVMKKENIKTTNDENVGENMAKSNNWFVDLLKRLFTSKNKKLQPIKDKDESYNAEPKMNDTDNDSRIQNDANNDFQEKNEVASKLSREGETIENNESANDSSSQSEEENDTEPNISATDGNTNMGNVSSQKFDNQSDSPEKNGGESLSPDSLENIQPSEEIQNPSQPITEGVPEQQAAIIEANAETDNVLDKETCTQNSLPGNNGGESLSPDSLGNVQPSEEVQNSSQPITEEVSEQQPAPNDEKTKDVSNQETDNQSGGLSGNKGDKLFTLDASTEAHESNDVTIRFNELADKINKDKESLQNILNRIKNSVNKGVKENINKIFNDTISDITDFVELLQKHPSVQSQKVDGTYELKAENERLTKELKEANSKISDLEPLAKKHKDKIEEVKKNAQSEIDKEKDKDEKKFNSLKDEKEKEINKLKKEIQETKKKHNREINQKEEEFKNIKSDKKELTEQLENIKKDLNKTEKELKNSKDECNSLRNDQKFYLDHFTHVEFAKEYVGEVRQLFKVVKEVEQEVIKLINSNKISDRYFIFKAIAAYKKNLSAINLDNFYAEVTMITVGELVVNSSGIAKLDPTDKVGALKQYFFNNYLKKYINALVVYNETLIGLHHFVDELSETDTRVFKNFSNQIKTCTNNLGIDFNTVHVMEKDKYTDLQVETIDAGKFPSGSILEIDNCKVYMQGGSKPNEKIRVKVQL